MERESATHLVNALRLSSDNTPAADEIGAFVVDLLETVEFSAASKVPTMRDSGVDTIGVTPVRGVPLTDG